MRTVEAICYLIDKPPSLPVAVMVRFDDYTGPTVHDGTVPITPVRRSWTFLCGQCSRLQLPLKLAWAVTIHKSQGLTLDKVVIDVGKEFSCGLSFVACSRVRKLSDILFVPPFPLQRLTSIARSRCLHERKEEDQRLLSLQEGPPLEDMLVHNEEEESMDVHVEVGTPSPPVHEDEDQSHMEWMTSTPSYQHHHHSDN